MFISTVSLILRNAIDGIRGRELMEPPTGLPNVGGFLRSLRKPRINLRPLPQKSRQDYHGGNGRRFKQASS